MRRLIATWAYHAHGALSSRRCQKLSREAQQEAALLSHRLTESVFESERLGRELQDVKASTKTRLKEAMTSLASLQGELEATKTDEKRLAQELHEARMSLVQQSEQYDKRAVQLESEARDASHTADEARREATKAGELCESMRERLHRKTSLEAEMSLVIARADEDARRAMEHEAEQDSLERELRAITEQFRGLKRARDESQAASEHYKAELGKVTTELHAAQTEAAVAQARLRSETSRTTQGRDHRELTEGETPRRNTRRDPPLHSHSHGGEELRAVDFDAMDRDGDGVVDRDEFEQFLVQQSQKGGGDAAR